MILRRAHYSAALKRAAIMAWLFLILVAPPANAQLSLVLLPANRNGSPGITVPFYARLTNLNPGTPLYLNGIEFDIQFPSASYMTPDDSAFFFEAPGSLSSTTYPSDFYEGHLFDVQLADPIPLEELTGNVTILGGATPTTLDTLATQQFTVSLNGGGENIPEPPSFLLILPALVRWKSRSRRQDHCVL